jgi:hypothetical protein
LKNKSTLQADRKFFIEIADNCRFEVTIVAGSKTKKKKGKPKKKK